jgi:pimeloyl-ACP methyl ester carboxylesterase
MSRTPSLLALPVAFVTAFLTVARAAPPPDAAGPGAKSGKIEVPADHRSPKGEKLSLVYERMGKGKRPAILLHGGPGVGMPASKILPGSEPGRMALEHYDLVYFDQRGASRSLRPEEAKLDFVKARRALYAMDQYIGDIEVIRTKLFGAGAKVTVFGSSWGGVLGLGYAVAHPDKVEALVLGSFSASGWISGRVCQTAETAVLAAEQEVPELARAMKALREAIAKKKIVWHRGKKDQRALRLSDVVEILMPFAMKARYVQAAALLGAIAKQDPKGQGFLDELAMNELSTAGASMPGAATFCQELAVRRDLEAAGAASPPSLYCDSQKVASELATFCAPFWSEQPPRGSAATTGGKAFDVERKLSSLRMPALVFAGRLDPVVPWQATASTALRMGNATFLLVKKGGHTPFDEGGACFARAIESLATKKLPVDLSCL